jgi:Na+/H+ antiporter NhaC
MQHVVRSRIPFALVAGAIAILVFAIYGNGEALPVGDQGAEATPITISLLLALVVVIASSLKGRHILESLTYGIITAIVIGISIGTLSPSDLFSVPAERGVSTGIIQNGVNGVIGVIMFAIFIMAAVQILIGSGLLKSFIEKITHTVIKTKRQAESLIFGSSILGSMLVTSNGGSLLLIGPTIVKPLADKFKMAKSRAANLLDCGVCSLFYIMPWSLAVVVWYGAIEGAANQFDLPLPEPTISLMAPYPLALFGVMIVSIITGWNSNGTKEEQEQNKS